ncbi:hypothetical protein SLS58_006059 [Diplodia intermedia]|uniref:2EXR domain-containing protein n=1 Tax=Diplodia intermedia TaxID=856260 RepID=A0ABR3TPQ4_9PEZI
MSFTATATMRGLSGMLHRWLPQDATPNTSTDYAASFASTPTRTTNSRKRKRDAPGQPNQTPDEPEPAPAKSRLYQMRNRTAKSYAEIDSEDELINESDDESDDEYGVAPRQKPKKTKPLPKSQIFPIMRLPRELRDMIYTHALTDPIGAVYIKEHTHRYRRCAVRVPEGPQHYLLNYGHWTEQQPSQAMAPWPISTTYYHSASTPPPPPPPPHTASLTPALLAVCRRIRDEATPLLYAQPMLFEDTAALHAFLAPLPPPSRAALRDVTVLGVRGGWGRSMRAAFDVAALTLLAEGATALNVLRYHDESYREGWNDSPQLLAARRFYRRAFHWLDAVARERGVDEAVGAVEVIGLSNSTSSMKVPRPSYENENTTIAWVNFEGVGRIESSSAAINRLIATTSSSISILPFTAPSPNSSYTLTFDAPAIKCETLSAAIANNTIQLADAATLQKAWNESMSADLSSSTLFNQLYTGKTMSVLDTHYIPNHFFINTNGAGAGGRNYSCHMWNASYTVLFRSVDGALTSTITALAHTAPLRINGSGVATDYAPGQIAYWSLYSALADILVTRIYYGSTCSLVGADAALFKTGIAACPEIMSSPDDDDDTGGCGTGATSFEGILSPWMCRNASVPRAVEDLSHNVSLSLLSSALFADATPADVAVTAMRNYYAYNWRNLLYAYLAAVVAALVCVAVGVDAYVANGYSASASFSSIVFTTRNAELDALADGRCLGARPVPREAKRTMLRYGVLREEEADGGRRRGVPHVAFGLRDTVGPLKKGELCS